VHGLRELGSACVAVIGLLEMRRLKYAQASQLKPAFSGAA